MIPSAVVCLARIYDLDEEVPQRNSGGRLVDTVLSKKTVYQERHEAEEIP